MIISQAAKTVDQSPPAIPLAPTDEERLLRETVATIARTYGNAYFSERTAAGEPPSELWEELAAAGFIGANLPEKSGGGGLGIAALCELINMAKFAGVEAASEGLTPRSRLMAGTSSHWSTASRTSGSWRGCCGPPPSRARWS
jgi:alkylation response protein AidB-like acyl-CoA dehydrogenase